eukprot:gene18941-22667_t
MHACGKHGHLDMIRRIIADKTIAVDINDEARKMPMTDYHRTIFVMEALRGALGSGNLEVFKWIVDGQEIKTLLPTFDIYTHMDQESINSALFQGNYEMFQMVRQMFPNNDWNKTLMESTLQPRTETMLKWALENCPGSRDKVTKACMQLATTSGNIKFLIWLQEKSALDMEAAMNYTLHMTNNMTTASYLAKECHVPLKLQDWFDFNHKTVETMEYIIANLPKPWESYTISTTTVADGMPDPRWMDILDSLQVSFGENYLLHAVQNLDLAQFRQLCDRHASILLSTQKMEPILKFACQRGRVEHVRWLLFNGNRFRQADDDQDYYNCHYYSVRLDYPEVFKSLFWTLERTVKQELEMFDIDNDQILQFLHHQDPDAFIQHFTPIIQDFMVKLFRDGKLSTFIFLYQLFNPNPQLLLNQLELEHTIPKEPIEGYLFNRIKIFNNK